MWGRHAAVVVAANLLAAGLLLAALIYCWPRSPGARGPLHELRVRRTESVNCARTCMKNEPPRECYYEFVIRPQVMVDLSCDATDGLNSSSCISRIKAVPRRMVFAVNGQVPGPPVQVCVGDVVVADVWNKLPGQQVSVHWHGVRQLGSPHMDGVSMVTQCPIPASSRFRYVFQATDPGTHFYRAHAVSQHAAGVFGAVVVREPPQQDHQVRPDDQDLLDHTLMMSTWPAAAGGAGPTTIAISGEVTKAKATRDARFLVLPGRKYRFRLINAAAADCPMLVRFDQHVLLIIAKDGVPTAPLSVQHVLVFPGDRYDVVLRANQPASSYALRVKGYNACSDVYEEASLVYPATAASSTAPIEEVMQAVDKDAKKSFLETCPDAAACPPRLKGLGAGPQETDQPDVRFYLPFDANPVDDFDGRVDFRYLHEEAPYYPAYLSAGARPARLPQFSNVSFMYPSSPLLSQPRDVDSSTLCSEDRGGRPRCNAHAHTGFCECTRVLSVPLNASVELVLVDQGGGSDVSRTFHMHGHVFRLVGRRSLGRPLGDAEVQGLDARGELARDLVSAPAMDTAAVPNKGYAVWRLRADNPGYWLLESRSGDVADDAGLQLLLRVGTDADIPATPAGFPRCGTFKGPDFLFT